MTHVARYEAVLALPDDRPLAHVTFDPDPLDGIARACAQAGAGEHVGVALACLPVAHRALRGEAGGGGHPWAAAFGDVLLAAPGRTRPADRDPVEVTTERHEVREQASKLTAGGPVVAAQLLIRASAATRARAWHLAQEAAAGLAPWAGENRWTVRRVPRRRRAAFDRRFETGRFGPRRRQLVTLREIDGLLRPPTKKCMAPVARSLTSLGGPADLPSYDGHPVDVLPLGRRHRPDGAELIGVRKADTLFGFLTGGSGRGKTELAINQAVHLIRTGEGVWYVDPHGDALERMKPYIAEREVAGRLVELNLAAHRDVTPTWNLLSMATEKAVHGADRTDPRVMDAIERKGAALVASFAAALRWDERNTRALSLTEFGARTLLELSLQLPDDLAPTVFQLLPLLSDQVWRERVLPYLSPSAQDYWRTRFTKLSPEAITPVTNLVDRMSQSAAVVGMFGASLSTFDPRRAIDSGQVVLACPKANDSVAGIVANFLVYGLRSALLSRTDTAADDRRDVWAFLDEAQSYDSASAGTLRDMLEQARKFGLHALVMCQSPTALSEGTRRALQTNRSHLLTATLDPDGAGLMAKQMGHDLDPQEIVQLKKWHTICSIAYRGETTEPFEVQGVAVHELWAACQRSPAEVAALEAAGRRNIEHRPVSEVIAHQGLLADRIVAWLAANGAPGAGPPGPPRRRVRTG